MNICVIGGANIDIGGFSRSKALLNDSNSGSIRYSFGGVARNISENLSRLGANTALITAFGDDFHGRKLKEDCQALNIDISHSLDIIQERTSSYLFIADNNGDMICAINDMGIYSNLNIRFFREKIHVINSFDLCILDANLEEDTLGYLLNNVEVPIFMDPVSLNKGKKVLPYLSKITGFKPNLLEARSFTGAEDHEEAARILLKKGVRNVFISLSEKGLYYTNGKAEGIVRPLDIKVKNTTGAGDCLLGSLAFAYCLGYSIEDCAVFGLSASQICISSEDTVSKDINFASVKEMEKEVRNG